MKIYKKKMVERKKVKYVICNECGKNIRMSEYKDFLSITKQWGYNSNYDGETHEFDICQDCYENLTSNLKIEPKVTRKKRFFCF